jgi:hypothetical protein
MTKVVEGGALEGDDFVTDSGQEEKKCFSSCPASLPSVTQKQQANPKNCRLIATAFLTRFGEMRSDDPSNRRNARGAEKTRLKSGEDLVVGKKRWWVVGWMMEGKLCC